MPSGLQALLMRPRAHRTCLAQLERNSSRSLASDPSSLTVGWGNQRLLCASVSQHEMEPSPPTTRGCGVIRGRHVLPCLGRSGCRHRGTPETGGILGLQGQSWLGSFQKADFSLIFGVRNPTCVFMISSPLCLRGAGAGGAGGGGGLLLTMVSRGEDRVLQMGWARGCLLGPDRQEQC